MIPASRGDPKMGLPVAPAMHLYFLVGGANLDADSFVGVLEHHNMSIIDAPVVAMYQPFPLVEEG
jgi:hypothetical protein